MRKILLKLSKHLVVLLELWVKFFIKKCPEPSVIFIVGVPRSGSTFLYQKLTNTLKFAYTDNYTQYVSNQSFIGGSIASEMFLRDKSHDCESSNFGDTSKCGFRAPSEAGKYWSKLRRNNNFSRIKKDFSFIEGYTKKPYLVKNLYNSLFINEISRALKNAKFIYIIRNKEHNINSLRKAREKLGIPSNEDWSTMPNYTLDFDSEEDRLQFQYEEINRLIAIMLEDKDSICIDYEKLISDTSSTINGVLKFCFSDDE